MKQLLCLKSENFMDSLKIWESSSIFISDSIDLAIRGPPAIISAREQWGKILECAFTAEPLPQVVRVLDLSKSEKSAIVHEVFNHNSTKIEIQIDVGQYECQVQNELGMTSTVIAILPEGKILKRKFQKSEYQYEFNSNRTFFALLWTINYGDYTLKIQHCYHKIFSIRQMLECLSNRNSKSK